MVKQITWDDQWIGYDDAETIALKKKQASELCFGGTMIWSVDFDTGNGRYVVCILSNNAGLSSKKCEPLNTIHEDRTWHSASSYQIRFDE